jgi:hypothetical protein
MVSTDRVKAVYLIETALDVEPVCFIWRVEGSWHTPTASLAG